MNIFISRAGHQYGPYPIYNLDAMVSEGRVVPTDLICTEGSSEWIPISAFLGKEIPENKAPLKINRPTALSLVSSPKAPPLIPASPPVIENKAVAAPQKPMLPCVSKMSIQEVENEVMQGGRFVLFQYCISIAVLSFKRPSSIVFLKSHEDGFSSAFGNSSISFVAGWWGIPWGPIWTISTIGKNAFGGTDVTREVLTDMFGQQKAASIMAQRKLPSPTGKALKIFRWSLLGAIILPFILMFISIYLANREESGSSPISSPVAAASHSPAQPDLTGQSSFESANEQIYMNNGQTAFGNSSDARILAGVFSRKMRNLQSEFFTGGESKGYATKGEYLTWCEWRADRCVFLVHVPDLRHFTGSAQATLGEIAWATAQMTLAEKNLSKPGMKLAIGIRGALFYERVLEGQIVEQYKTDREGLTTITRGNSAYTTLYKYFTP